jgi:hypothetical protein
VHFADIDRDHRRVDNDLTIRPAHKSFAWSGETHAVHLGIVVEQMSYCEAGSNIEMVIMTAKKEDRRSSDSADGSRAALEGSDDPEYKNECGHVQRAFVAAPRTSAEPLIAPATPHSHAPFGIEGFSQSLNDRHGRVVQRRPSDV